MKKQLGVNWDQVNSLRLPCVVEQLWEVTDVEQLTQVLMLNQDAESRPVIVGGLTNVVLPVKLTAPVIRLRPGSAPVKVAPDGRITVWAGQMMAATAWSVIEQGWQGMADFTSLPGTVGGAIYNNAHFGRHLIADNLIEVQFYDYVSQKLTTLTTDQLDFGYDQSWFHQQQAVIVTATWQLQAGDKSELLRQAQQAQHWRQTTQPHGQASAGCFWQNPINTDDLRQLWPQWAQQERLSAGFVIDQAGLKGKRVGAAQVSEQHAAFILNLGGANQKDILTLAAQVRAQVAAKFGVVLTPEVVILTTDGSRLNLDEVKWI